MLGVSKYGIASLVCLIVATVLCALGLVTVEWMTLKAKTANATADPHDNMIAWSQGLWEECRAPIAPGQTDDQCIMTLRQNVKETDWCIRIILCVGSACNVFAVIAVVLWFFGRKCKHSFGWRSFTLLLTSLSAFLNVLPTLAFGLSFAKELNTNSSGPLQYTLGWSFYVTVVGAVFLSPANFFICQHTHDLDDEDNLLYEKHQLRNHGDDRDINTSYM